MRKRIPKWSSVKYRLNQFLIQERYKIIEKKNKSLITGWIKSLKNKSGDVLIGGNFAKSGGVRNHILAINKYSKLGVELVPNNKLIEQFSGADFQKKYRDLFFNFKLEEGTILHSHVYPWYIEWCKEKQKQGHYWIHTYHLPYFPEHASNKTMKKWQDNINKALENEACDADVKLSVAKWQQKFLKETKNIDTLYIPNGVDVGLCDKGDSDIAFKKLGFKDYILNVSRHDPVKNPAEFVLLAQSMPDYNFVIIGDYLTRELFKEHYTIVAPKNLTILGKMSQLEIQHFISASSILVSTSKREGLPTLVLEVMAQSKPVVVSNEPGSMEAIDHGKYGYFYELGDIEDLKNQTLLAIENTIKPVKARQKVLEEYDWRVVIKKLDKIYNQINS